jgi:hypothetical protein
MLFAIFLLLQQGQVLLSVVENEKRTDTTQPLTQFRHPHDIYTNMSDPIGSSITASALGGACQYGNLIWTCEATDGSVCTLPNNPTAEARFSYAVCNDVNGCAITFNRTIDPVSINPQQAVVVFGQCHPDQLNDSTSHQMSFSSTSDIITNYCVTADATLPVAVKDVGALIIDSRGQGVTNNSAPLFAQDCDDQNLAAVAASFAAPTNLTAMQ